jgi:hypothetical protein
MKTAPIRGGRVELMIRQIDLLLPRARGRVRQAKRVLVAGPQHLYSVSKHNISQKRSAQ